jgi:lysozyme
MRKDETASGCCGVVSWDDPSLRGGEKMSFSAENLDMLLSQLRRDEGAKRDESGRHVAYLDTEGILTVGYGHNCEASPVDGVDSPGDTISEEEAIYIFRGDVQRHIEDFSFAAPWVRELSPARQAVLYNMAYNLGVKGLLAFKNTLVFASIGDYTNAARNMLLSKWASQVKGRAKRLAKQMESGEWQ